MEVTCTICRAAKNATSAVLCDTGMPHGMTDWFVLRTLQVLKEFAEASVAQVAYLQHTLCQQHLAGVLSLMVCPLAGT